MSSIIFISYQHAEAITITAIPKSSTFGPNDWIIVNLKIQGYNGGPISWTAHRPNNSTISGNLTQVKPDGTVTQQIVRDAFDNYFGNWSITYKYDGINQTATFKVNPIVLHIFTDKNLYYEPDVMHANITTSYYIPVAVQAEFFHLNFYDQKGKVVSDIPQVDIRAFQPSVIYNFHMIGLADYHPPGLYKLRVQYYNTIVEVPFLLGKYSELMQVSAQTDKSTYRLGDIINMELLFTRVTQSEGTLKITDPSGNVTTHQFQVFSVHTHLILNGITKKVGTYSYVLQYAGVSTSGSFTVNPNPKLLPNIEFDIFLDKLTYRPGDIIYARAYISQVLVNSVDLWVVDPNGVEYPRISLPITSFETIFPHKIGENYTTGQWQLYMDYDGIVKSVPFYVIGSPVRDDELLNVNQFSIPSFVSNFGTAASLKDPSGIAIDTDNDVYVVDAGNSQIKKFDSNGTLLLSWGSTGSGNGQFFHPNGIYVGKKYVYVADTGNARIQMFDKQGNFIYRWGSYGDGRGMFHTPVGLAADSSGDLFVADSGRGTIQIFNTQDQYSGEIRPLLTEGANFTALNGLAFDSKDYFYTSSSDNKILKFSDIGKFINFFGSSGTENGRFNNPTVIATDAKNNFYVADTGNHRIQKFDPYGNFLLSWGSEGNMSGQFEEPVGLATDSSGNIYVMDKKNDNIQKFSLYGTGSRVIPYWVKERIQGWSEGALGKRDFVLAIQFMINQGLINATMTGDNSLIHVPEWLKNDAKWWAQGQIDDKMFTNSLQYLISKGIFRV
ncbi:MAG: hypothetical protein KGI25_06700 [Thaumarchaeota archaeon]|nr:hypothetical protein [Nitrososphaerota archaeon]